MVVRRACSLAEAAASSAAVGLRPANMVAALANVAPLSISDTPVQNEPDIPGGGGKLAGGAVGVPVPVPEPGGVPPVGGEEPVGGTTGGAPEGPVFDADSPPPLQPAMSATATMVAHRVRPKTDFVLLVPLIALLL
jgi:hypothetical protein